jgi:hypothetical protein
MLGTGPERKRNNLRDQRNKIPSFSKNALKYTKKSRKSVFFCLLEIMYTIQYFFKSLGFIDKLEASGHGIGEVTE